MMNLSYEAKICWIDKSQKSHITKHHKKFIFTNLLLQVLTRSHIQAILLLTRVRELYSLYQVRGRSCWQCFYNTTFSSKPKRACFSVFYAAL